MTAILNIIGILFIITGLVALAIVFPPMWILYALAMGAFLLNLG